jgi:hypothetical protein
LVGFGLQLIESGDFGWSIEENFLMMKEIIKLS